MPPQMGGPLPTGEKPGNGMAVAGLVLGILAVVLCFIPFLNWILALLGIIFGAVGNGKANRGAKGKGLAMAGLILGIIGAILGTTIVVWAWREANRQRDYMYNNYRYNRYGSIIESPDTEQMPTPDRVA